MNPTIDPIDIDRLVDGELGPERRRDLLLRLETTPDGWRSLAIAFLENREFTAAGRAWGRELAVSAPPAPVRPLNRPGRSSPRRLAVAAALIGVAFVGGWLAGGKISGRGEGRVVATSGPVAPPPVAVEPKPSRTAPLARDIAWAEAQPAAISDYDKSKWSRLGYQIEQKRKLITMDLKDGRRVTVPVDDVRVDYVGRPTY